jgi:ABC-type multidrug transport system fused ATPase/permease subunit
MILSAIGDGDVFLFIFEFFLFVIWFWLLLTIFGDIFRDHEMSGGLKAFWCIFVIILPFLGIFIYLIARGGGMAQRAAKAQKDMQDQMDQYVRSTAGTGSAADQISQAKSLLDAGTIDQAEFDKLKAKALAS